jgi:hypothetical protein
MYPGWKLYEGWYWARELRRGVHGYLCHLDPDRLPPYPWLEEKKEQSLWCRFEGAGPKYWFQALRPISQVVRDLETGLIPHYLTAEQWRTAYLVRSWEVADILLPKLVSDEDPEVQRIITELVDEGIGSKLRTRNTISVRGNTYDRLKAYCKEQDTGVSTIIEKWVHERLDEDEAKAREKWRRESTRKKHFTF